MVARRNKKRKGKKIKVNMKGVESKRVLLPEGDVRAKCLGFEQEEGEKGDYLAWQFLTIDDDKAVNGQKLYFNTSLLPQALWNLRGLLEAMGVEVPDGPMEVDPDDVTDRELYLSTEHDTFKGRKKSAVVDYMSVAAFEGSEEGEEDDADVEDDDTEVPTEDEVNEMEADDLSELIETHELDVSFKGMRSITKKRAAVIKAMNDADLFEGEEEEEEEGDEVTEDEINEMDDKELAKFVKENELKVKLKGTLTKKRAAVIKAAEEEGLLGEEEEGEGVTADEVNDMDEDDLQGLIDEHELSVNLKKLRSLSKKRSAVIDALEEADLLAEED